MQALIIGAGQIGRAVALRLLEDGWRVTVVQRSSSTLASELLDAGAEGQVFDRDDDAALKAAIGPGFDAVIDTAAFNGVHARQWAELRGHMGRLAVISTGSVYADAEGRTLDEARETGFPEYPVPVRENQVRARPGPQTYSTRKVELEDGLLEHFDDGLTILRPFAVYGPGSRAPREWWFLARILAGWSKIPLADKGRSRFHTSATANIAELCRVALDRSGVHVLNAADPHAPTVAEIGAAILDAFGQGATLVPYAGPPRSIQDATPWSVARPLVADMSAAASLGYQPVGDYRTLVAETCSALLSASEQLGWKAAFPGLQPYPAVMFEPGADPSA